jgi:hypothetical protein
MSSDPDQPDGGLPEPELLDDEPVRRRRRGIEREAGEVRAPARARSTRVRWVWCAVVVALVIGSTAWYVDHRMRADERAALEHCERRLRTASVLSDIRMGMMVNYVRPRVAETDVSPRLHLADLMSTPAREQLPVVLRANRICWSVAIKPWHFSLVSRRSTATAYADALVALLRAVASKGSTSFRHDPPFTELRTAAGAE